MENNGLQEPDLVLEMEDLFGGSVDTVIKDKPKEEKLEDIKEEIAMNVNATGQLVEDDQHDDSEYGSILDEYKLNPDPNFDLDSISLLDTGIGQAIKELFDLNDEDTDKMVNIVKHYRQMHKNERKNYKVYDILPDKLKSMIVSIVGPNSKSKLKNDLALDIINKIVTEASMDEEIKTIRDLDKELKSEMNLTDTVENFAKYQEGLFGDNLRNHAEAIKEKDPNKSKLLLNIADEFTEATNLTKFEETLKNSWKLFRPRSIDLEDKYFYKTYLAEFNAKYTNSTLTVSDISTAYETALKYITDDNISEVDIKKFFIAFCKYCKDMDPNNVVEHTFMYYVPFNISSIPLLEVNDNAKFLHTVLDSVKRVINTIKSF